MARLRGAKDEITHYIFDTQNVEVATTQLTYFMQDLSAGAQLTNLKAAGRFPSPESFDVKTLQMWVPHATVPADVGLILQNCYITLYVGKTQYIDGWPLCLIPVCTGFNFWGATDAAAVDVSAGAMSGVAARVLHKTIPIETDEPFRLVMQWSAAGGVSATVPLTFILGGLLTRQVQ